MMYFNLLHDSNLAWEIYFKFAKIIDIYNRESTQRHFLKLLNKWK